MLQRAHSLVAPPPFPAKFTMLTAARGLRRHAPATRHGRTMTRPVDDGDATSARRAGGTGAPPSRHQSACEASAARRWRGMTERIVELTRVNCQRLISGAIERRAGEPRPQAMRARSRHARRPRGVRDAAAIEQGGEEDALLRGRPARAWRGCGGRRGGAVLFHRAGSIRKARCRTGVLDRLSPGATFAHPSALDGAAVRP